MKKIILAIFIATFSVACGPSEAEQEMHEEQREIQNQELEDSWDEELNDLLEDDSE